MLTDDKIKEMAINACPKSTHSDIRRFAYIAGAKAAREEMMKDTEEMKTKFFATFGEQSFRGYSLDQCNAIWEFFVNYIIKENK